MQRRRFERSSALQCFQKRDVLRYVVVLPPNPAGDADGPAVGTLDYDANTGRPWVSQRSAIHVGYEIRHPAFFRSHQHASERLLRQVLYSEYLQRGATVVENRNLEVAKTNKHHRFKQLQFSICTGLKVVIAHKNGVDIYRHCI